jgi:uncharacterized protein YjiS (DUF1127 family)
MSTGLRREEAAMRTFITRLRASRRMRATLAELDPHLLRDIGLLERNEPAAPSLWGPRLARRLDAQRRGR